MDREKSAQIVPFSPELLPLVRGFSERYWSRPHSDAYYEWRYLRPQPFSRMFLAVQDDRCLGMLFALRKPYRIAGRPLDCLEVFDWHCLPGEKGTGIGIRLMRAMMRQPEPVLSVGGTADVHATLPKMGWEHIGAAPHFELVISPDALAARLRHRAGLHPALTQGALQLLSAGYFTPHRRCVPSTGLVSGVAVLPAGVRELYRDAGGYGFVQQPQPDVQRWIMDSSWSGHFGYLVFALAGRVRGWAMTRTFATKSGPEAAIVEIFAPRPDVALYTWMVSEAATALLVARPRRIHSRASCPVLQAALRANHFRVLPPDPPVHLWPRGAWDHAGPLHITLGHSDAPLLPYACEASAGPGPGA
jgi:hypothetical protein